MTELEKAADDFVKAYEWWKDAVKESPDFDAWKCEASRYHRDKMLSKYKELKLKHDSCSQ